MGVESVTTGRASRNRIGACTRGPGSRADLAVRVVRGRNLFIPPHPPPWLARLVGLLNRHVAADGSPGQTDDGKVSSFKLEPTDREV